MYSQFSEKKLNVLPPAAIIDNAAAGCLVIDTQGWDSLEIVVQFGAMDIAVAAMKVQQSDVKASATALTSGVDVTGTVVGTDANDTGSASTLPSATADNTLFSFLIDLRGKKRYILPVITLGDGSAGTYVSVLGILGRGKEGPRTAVQAGYAQRICA